ncbi:cytochrome-c peroxidase [Methylotuvimicrobium sp. KM1]|uniref:cytochrome-c peroxidase n=1 Tax=Methylotuvimicrobium sp. KM1 TaxID=3377707 RepID=UPI00384CFACE
MKKIIKIGLLGAMFAPTTYANQNALTDMDFHNSSSEKIKLGQFLFYDKILSGNLNISCASCHHPMAGTGDGLALSVGEGGKGLGVTRDTGSGIDAIHERVPRNAPHLFNLGAKEFVTMFHDGRLTTTPNHPSGFDSPAGDALPEGLDHSLAAQAMFPVTSTTEMAGQAGENPVGDAATADNFTEVWRLLTARVMAIDEYRDLIHQAYPGLADQDVTFVHIANAIGAFEATAFRADNSRYDLYLRGEYSPSSSEKKGYKVFKDNCMSCHSGPLQTDHQFHALGIPQIGPGKGDGLFGYDDFGRERVTGNNDDRYRFRTPTLRNVAITGPWGHDGAYDTLEGMIRHHLNPEQSLDNYDISQARLPPRDDLNEIDGIIHSDEISRAELKARIELQPVNLTDQEIDSLLDFLNALTDTASLDMRNKVPYRVPSGLPIAD